MSEIVQSKHCSPSGGRSLVVEVSLTSDGSGDAAVSERLHGFLVRCVSNPGATAPTASWDYVITDIDGVDLLAGGGSNRSATVSEMAALPNNNPVRFDGAVTITGSNMGAAKDAVVRLYLVAGGGA